MAIHEGYYVSLHTGDPGKNPNVNEVSSAGYARQATTWASASTGTLSQVTWAYPPGSSITTTGSGGMITVAQPQYHEHECGIHDITYKAVRPGCPMCELDRQNKMLWESNEKLAGQLEMQTVELSKLKVNWEFLSAMREAVDLLDDQDLEFFKSILYQWRDEKSVGLKQTYGYDDNKKKSIIGFLVMPRGEDPWGYACTSIGGLAIASYFAEACAARGSAEAMAILARAVSDHLPGSLDESRHPTS